MKFSRQILILLLLLSCNNAEETCLPKASCTKGSMEAFWYPYGQDTIVAPAMQLKKGFQIIVDTTRRPSNFISFLEISARKRSLNLAMKDLIFDEAEAKLSQEEKMKIVETEKLEYGFHADTIHQINNRKELLVWIVNNTQDTLSIQMQDGSFICIKEAKNECNTWKPIEFMEFSYCGNSYYKEAVNPQEIKQFVANRFEGDQRVELRFKLLGNRKFYYSNSFWGTIDPCVFQIDTTIKEARYTLDKPLNLAHPF